jgi:hypothetical protein
MLHFRCNLAQTTFLVLLSVAVCPARAAAPEVIYGEQVITGPQQSAGLGTTAGEIQRAISPRTDAIQVTMGRSELLRPNREVKTIVVGNEAIADATLSDINDMIVLTGKTVGLTNLILLDADGNEILNATVQVTSATQGPRTTEVRVFRGAAETRYLCGIGYSNCNPAPIGATAADGGPCMNPEDIAADGSLCGDRAASVQAGGLP